MKIEYKKVFDKQGSRVKCISFHPYHPWVLVSHHTGEIELWDIFRQTLLATFKEHEGPVRAVAFHPSRNLFVSGGDDALVRIWNALPVEKSPETAKKTTSAASKDGSIQTIITRPASLYKLVGHLDYIRSVQFHGREPWILSASDDNTLRLWNWQSRDCLFVLTGHTHYVMAAKFGPLDTDTQYWIASASLDQTIRIWDCQALLAKKKGHPSDPSSSSSWPSQGYGSPGTDGRRMSRLAQPDLFAQQDVTLLYVLEGHERGVNCVDFEPHSGTLLASGSDDRQVKLWQLDAYAGSELSNLSGHFNNISSVKFLDLGRARHGPGVRSDESMPLLLLSNSEDKSLRVWDCDSRQAIYTLKKDTDRFWSVATSNASLGLIAAGHDSGFVVFQYESDRVHVAMVATTDDMAVLLHLSSQGDLHVLQLDLEGQQGPVRATLLAQLGPMPSVSRFSYSELDGTCLVSLEDTSVHVYPNVFLADVSGSSQTIESMGSVTPSFKMHAKWGQFVPNCAQQAILAVDAADETLQFLDGRGHLVAAFAIPMAGSTLAELRPSLGLHILHCSVQSNDLSGSFLLAFERGALLLRLVDLALLEPVELAVPRLRQVIPLDPQRALLIADHRIYLLTNQRSLHVLYLCASESPVSVIQSALLFEGVLYFSTRERLLYLIPPLTSMTQWRETAVGMVCALSDVVHCFLVSLTRSTAYFTAAGGVGQLVLRLSVDLTEPTFKRAVFLNDKSVMADFLGSGVLIGQSILAFLKSQGHADLVLPYLTDPMTRFRVALDAHLLDVAFSSLGDVEEKERQAHEKAVRLLEDNMISKKFVKDFPSSQLRQAWHQLGEALLLLGQHEKALHAFKQAGSLERLFYLHLLTDQLSLLDANLGPAAITPEMRLFAQLLTSKRTHLRPIDDANDDNDADVHQDAVFDQLELLLRDVNIECPN